MLDTIHKLLNFWFGDLGFADLPNSDRTSLWFGENEALKLASSRQFATEYYLAINRELISWQKTPRGCLALIILLDQFSRFIHKNGSDAFSADVIAQRITLKGIDTKMDQTLTLIERVFFYMPLVHAENIFLQQQSVSLFKSLVTKSLPETTQVYQLFLAYARAHQKVIENFGRFPQRNSVLKRRSTPAEKVFLKQF